MELVAVQNSRVVYLTYLYRPTGQLYLPEAVAKLIQRYSFVKYPTAEDLLKDIHPFGMGKFNDIQIDEMKIYPDGVIASSRSDSDLVDSFLRDLFDWAQKEFGFVQGITAKPERHYESYLIVKSKCDLALAQKPRHDITEDFNKLWRKKYFDEAYLPAGFALDCDPHNFSGRRKPMAFDLARRIGVPFEENVFFSTAPLTTKDHLALLSRLEDVALANLTESQGRRS
jgi:hypothetical protein